MIYKQGNGYPASYAAGAAIGTALMYKYGNRTVRNRPSYAPMVTQSNGIVMKKQGTRQKRTFQTALYKTVQSKHDTGEQAVSMTHNTLYTLNLTSRVTQGDTNSTRDGDAIIISGLKMKGFYNSNTTSGGYGFRIIVGYSGEEYSNGTFASGLGTTEVFLPNTSGLLTTAAQINPKAFTVIYDERLTCNSQLADVRDRVEYGFHVPLNNKKFIYQSSGSALGKTNNLYVIITSDIILGTAGVTATGGTTITWDFIYKNA